MILILLAIIFHIYANYVTHHRIIKNDDKYKYKHKPLFDIIHSNTLNMNKYKYIPDYLAFVFLLPLLYTQDNKCISMFFKIGAIIVILRSISILATDMPRSDIECNQSELKNYNLFFGHCYDKMFSGHVALTLLSLLILYHFNKINDGQMLFSILFHIVYSCFIIITRSHYTVDVLISYFITIPLFYYAANGLHTT